MANDIRIIVGGFLGLLPAGGVTWDYLQYPLGLSELGYDVYYIEDTQLWPVFHESAATSSESIPDLRHLTEVMDHFGLGRRWGYRDVASGQCYGLSHREITEICRSADVFINISCSTVMRDEYRAIPLRVLIDSDPMFTQIQLETGSSLTTGESSLRELVAAHNFHFTFGECFGRPECRMPSCGIDWLPTRQPICVDQWSKLPALPPNDSLFTTLMNWSAAPPLDYAGEKWGQKNVEFSKIIGLPSDVPSARLGVAVGQTTGIPFPARQAREAGWHVLEPRQCAADWRSYRDFISRATGEFSVAKETYVKAHTGWFSCRSACYLAAGRPVVTQDTGWTKVLPHGRGLLAFRDRREAAEQLRAVMTDWSMHSRAAREIASSFFDSRTVLRHLLTKLGCM